MGNNVALETIIQNKIIVMRNQPVIIDRDIAAFYEVETRVLNQAVKRNIERFPEEFCFQLTEKEFHYWKSQIVISNKEKMGLRKSPYAFTEQGVAMLSAVLKSDTAIKISISIIKAFIAMRRFFIYNAQIFQRLDNLEIKQIETDKRLNQVLKVIDSKEIKPSQGIFFDGQVFDAYVFINDLVKSAKKSLLLIDNYIDETVLVLFTQRKRGIPLTILTRAPSKKLELDVQKYNEQYPPIALKPFGKAHDRFLILDGKTIYHFGASLKDLGKKWFAFSKLDISAIELLNEIGIVT
ncbi:MAG: ORF6N domain-containing protein [Deltaproteobacteria bacterium]|nr:ORF6N domain-containing protein [Deltaproteobacteria bacterium]